MAKTLQERFDTLEKELQKPSFREGRGLANEVRYYIFDYPAAEELYVRQQVAYLQRKSEASGDGSRILVFDLYEILLDILRQKGYLEKCFALEQQKGFEKVSTVIANRVRVNATDGLIVEYIKERIMPGSTVFLTGIGKCYPIIRSHTIINNLHLAVDSVPVVMFYPGVFSGQELILFGEIKDDNYYRAIKLAP